MATKGAVKEEIEEGSPSPYGSHRSVVPGRASVGKWVNIKM